MLLLVKVDYWSTMDKLRCKNDLTQNILSDPEKAFLAL